MKKIILTALLALCLTVPAAASDGVITIQSFYNAKETADRMVSILKDKGMTVFNRIHHSKAAAKVGIKLGYTELIIFGNPKVGSPLMQCERLVAIDLPQKAVIWQDENGLVWVSYNDPGYLVKRHQIDGCTEVIEKVKNALAGITKAAASK